MIPWALNYDNTGVTVTLGELVDAGIKVWDFDYPSYYRGAEKTQFEQKVLDHYRFRQIGQETPARFLHYFRTRIREIMPYYLQLYKSVELLEAQEDPLESYKLLETYTRTATSESESSGTGSSETESTDNATSSETTTRSETAATTETATGNNTRRLSDTPQGDVSNLHDGYLTQHEETDSSETKEADTTRSGTEGVTGNNTRTGSEGVTTSSEGSASGSESETYSMTRRGNIGVQPLGYEINELRKAFINVDLQIIKELNDLFLMVY